MTAIDYIPRGSFKPPVRSRRAGTIAKWFGLSWAPVEARDAPDACELIDRAFPRRGQITLISGPSGSGKSSLVRELQSSARSQMLRWIDLSELRLPDAPIVDCFPSELALKDVLRALGEFGLSEAWTYLRTPGELSEGQRFRLKLALACAEAHSRDARMPLLVCDEFAAVLDRITAATVSHALRRAISRSGRMGAIVATSHDDVLKALSPDRVIRCDFGKIWIDAARPDEKGAPHAKL